MKLDIDIDKYDVLSLDIFDTLWLRTVGKPADVFEYVWKSAVEAEQNIRDITPYEFMKLRVEIENKARKKAPHREVTLDAIYNELPANIIKDITWLIKEELETEKALGYLNPDILFLIHQFKEKNKKIVLLSDMYLSKDEIIGLLESDGFDTEVLEDIIVSCEKKCSKQEGLLFQELINSCPGVSKDRIIHIGDNVGSDFEQAMKAGIQAYHYNVIPDKIKSIYEYEKIEHNIPQPALLSLRKIAADNSNIQLKYEKAAFEIGASILGPFLTLFTDHVVNRLTALNVHGVYPLMREGFILAELLKNEVAERKLQIKVKAIYTSRKASYIPSIEKIDREEIENIIGVRNITISELITIMGLEHEEFQELKEYFDVKLKVSHTITYNQEKSLKEYIIERFLEPACKAGIEQYVLKERKLYVDYIKQEIEDLKDAATVDIGYVGRIQHWTEKALQLEGIEHSLKHFLAIGITGERISEGMQIEGYAGTYAENQDLIGCIYRTPDLLEKLTSVCTGSTIGYKYDGKSVTPLLSQEINNKKYIDIVFEGIMSFQKYWFYFRKHRPDIANRVLKNRRDTLKILQRLFDLPTKNEVEVLMNLEADTNFGTNYVDSIITKQNIELLKEKGIEFVEKCNVSYTYENNCIVWPKGLITLFDEFYYLKKALKEKSTNEIIRSMQEVVEKMEEEGVTEISLYGAGENGRQFYSVCSLYHIKVNCFIDRKESLWGTKKEGIEIMGLQEAIQKGYHTFLITSLFSISEIYSYIMDSFQNTGEKAEIFHV